MKAFPPPPDRELHQPRPMASRRAETARVFRPEGAGGQAGKRSRKCRQARAGATKGSCRAAGRYASATPQPAKAPSAPDMVSVSPLDSALSVGWKASENATFYEVYYKMDSESGYRQWGGRLSNTSTVITGLTNGVTYSIYIQAGNAVGISGPSRTALGTPTAVDYSRPEGIPTGEDLPLLEDGKLLTWHGPNRFCRYLGVKPTGNYQKIVCSNGTLPFTELKKGPCLWAVTFSDFQMDAMSGHFGGEIRLAYLIEADGKVTPVTGGSVNGSILEAQKRLVFSTDRYLSIGYDGPYAMRLSGVSVAGTEE